MKQAFKKIAVRYVKPVVSDAVWQRLRRPRGLTPAEERRRRLGQMDLTELAREFRTDKWGRHFYTPHYERHLRHLRSEEFTLLEIGVGGYRRARRGGASLRMWVNFFPRATVVGLDIHDKSWLDRGRMHTVRGSQTDEKVLRNLIEEYGVPRVVIDDGSHRSAHIVKTFGILFPLLPDGAIYAIEDTQTSYWPEWGGSEDLDDPNTSMALVKRLVDGLNYEEFVIEGYQPSYTDLNIVAVHAYHNLVVIEKGPNAEGTRKRSLLRSRYAN